MLSYRGNQEEGEGGSEEGAIALRSLTAPFEFTGSEVKTV